MIKKVAEVHAIKKMANIRGVYAEEEFSVNKQGIVVDADPAPTTSNADNLKETPEEPEPEFITSEQVVLLQDEVVRVGKNLKKFIEYLKVDKISEIPYKTATAWLLAFSKQASVVKLEATPRETPKQAVADPIQDKIIARTLDAGASLHYVNEPEPVEGELVESKPVAEVIEVMPPKETKKESTGMAMLRETAQRLKDKKKVDVKPQPLVDQTIVPMEGDVCQRYNELDARFKQNPVLVSADELKFMNDCNAGEFRGKQNYNINW